MKCRNHSGMTLVETVVAVALFAVASGVIFTTVNVTQDAFFSAERRSTNLNEARVLMAACTKDIRTAVRLQAGSPPFTAADKTSMTFYANLNPTTGPRKIHLFVDTNSQLVSEVQTPDAGSIAPNYTYTGAKTNRFVGRYIANASSSPVFRYYDSSGAELTNTPLSTTDRLAVDSVKITLSIKKSTTLTLGQTTVVNQVRLGNLDYQATFE